MSVVSNSMTLWEGLVDVRVTGAVMISTQQYGFMPGKSSTDAMLALRFLIEKYPGQKELQF